MWPQAKDFKQPLEGRAEKKKGQILLGSFQKEHSSINVMIYFKLS